MAHSTVVLDNTAEDFKDAALHAVVILLWRVSETSFDQASDTDAALRQMLQDWRQQCSRYEGTGCIDIDTAVLSRSEAHRKRFTQLIDATERFIAQFGDSIPPEEINSFILEPRKPLFRFHPTGTASESLKKLRALVNYNDL